MTVDVRPKNTGELVQELAQRLYRVEQESSRPSAGGVGGAPDTDPSVNTITIDGIVVGADASPATGLSLTTGSFMEDIWIDADWVAPADGTAGSYDVELARKVGSSYELEQVFHTSGTDLRMSSLWPQTTYGVRVTAINRIDVRSASEPPSGFQDITTGIDATVPAQVTGVSIVAGFRTATVTWNEVADRDVARGAGIYELNLDVSNTFPAPISEFTAGTVASFGDLATGTLYYARVRAVDNSGNAGAWSAVVSDATGQVGTVDLADVAVTTGKLANLAVDNSKLAALAVDAANLVDSSVTSTKIANLAVGSAAIAALAVGTAKIDDLAVTTAKIGSLQVTTAKIADLAVTTAKIENLAVDNGKIANLDAGKINAGTISANRIASNSIDVDKLTSSTLTSKTITIGAGGVLKIGNAPTTGVLINDQGIRLYSGSSVKVALDVLGTASFEGNINASTITSSTLTSATITSGTITGLTVRTASSGKRISMEAGVIDQIKFYTGDAGESSPGTLLVGVTGSDLEMGADSPRTSGNEYGTLRLGGAKASSNQAYVQMQITTSAGVQDAALLLLGKTSSADAYLQLTKAREFLLNFGFTGTNAEISLKGSGDYAFVRLYGGGSSNTLNSVVGLGTGFHVLDGSNSTFRPIQASAFNVASAAKTKKNVRDEKSATSRVMSARVVRFNRINPPVTGDAEDLPHIRRALDGEEIGFLADQLWEVVPEAVVIDGSQAPIGVNLSVMVALLFKAVQELQTRVDQKG